MDGQAIDGSPFSVNVSPAALSPRSCTLAGEPIAAGGIFLDRPSALYIQVRTIATNNGVTTQRLDAR